VTTRLLRVELGADVANWQLTRATARATERARDLLAADGVDLVGQPDWVFEAAEGQGGHLTVAVGTVSTRPNVVTRAQKLMAEQDHVPACAACLEWARMDRLRWDRDLTIREACAQLGLNARAYYRHRLVHPFAPPNGRNT
jgi:hypothetical protein